MARPYSDDLRRKLLEGARSGQRHAGRPGGPVRREWKISSARKRTGSVERKPYQAGPKVRVDREAVRRLLEAKPDLYLRELQAELEASTGTQVSTPHLWKIVGELGFRLKKSLHALERDTEANRQRREVFVEQLRSIAPKRLVFLDESGVRRR